MSLRELSLFSGAGLCASEPEGEWGGRLGDGSSPWHFDPADLPHGDGSRCEERWRTEPVESEHASAEHDGEEWRDDWELEPYVGRVVDGLASRVDRLRALGNGQVPQTMAAAFTYLAAAAGILP